jgi:hypothetical protein
MTPSYPFVSLAFTRIGEWQIPTGERADSSYHCSKNAWASASAGGDR